MQTRVDSILTARSYRWSTLQEDRDFPPIWQAWDSLSQGYRGVILCFEIPIQITRITTPETNIKFAPARLRHPKRKQSYSNYPFSGAFAVSFREGIHVEPLSSRYRCAASHFRIQRWVPSVQCRAQTCSPLLRTAGFCFWV